MNRQFAGFEIEVPFGPAAGAVNGANEELFIEQMKQVIASPVGFALGGSFTYNPSEGNAHHGRTYYHNPNTGQTINSMGLPNIGIDAAIRLYPELVKRAGDAGKPLGASVSPAKGEDASIVLPDMVYRMFEAGAHFVEANYSCPNKITDDGDREPILCYDSDRVAQTRESILTAIGIDQYFGEKWSPPLHAKVDTFRRLARDIVLRTGVYYIAAPNTIPNQELFDENDKPALDVPGNLGGVSGRATQALGRKTVNLLRELLPPNIAIISASGVDSGEEVYHRTVQQGALLASGVTVYFENEARGVDYGRTGVQVTEEYAAALERAA